MTGNADPPGLLSPAEPNPEEGNLVLTRVAGTLQALVLISILIAIGVKPMPNTGPFNTNFLYLGIALMLMIIQIWGLSWVQILAPSWKPGI